MEDIHIVDLYWARAENAMAESSAKYGKYCRYLIWKVRRFCNDKRDYS